MSASLNGIRVIDMSHVIAGPLTSFFLAQLGAEVLKIEKPVSGDVLRANKEPIKTDIYKEGPCRMQGLFIFVGQRKRHLCRNWHSEYT